HCFWLLAGVKRIFCPEEDGAGTPLLRHPRAEELNRHWPASILAVIKPTRSTTCVPFAVSITLATCWNSTSSSPFTNITRSARVLKMLVRRLERSSQLTSSWLILSLGFPPPGGSSTCTTTVRSVGSGL